MTDQPEATSAPALPRREPLACDPASPPPRYGARHVEPADVLIIDDLVRDPVDVGPSPAYRETVDNWWRQHQRTHTPSPWSSAPPSPNRIDPFTRARILERLDVDPWRVPTDGLLELDETHDEWRIELWRDHRDPDAGRIVVRRYAGRRRPWSDLSPYIAGRPGDRVMWRPEEGGDPHGRAVAEWQRRLRYARGGRTGPAFPVKPDRDDQVDAMSYSISTLAQNVAPAAAALQGVGDVGRRFLREVADEINRARRGRA